MSGWIRVGMEDRSKLWLLELSPRYIKALNHRDELLILFSACLLITLYAVMKLNVLDAIAFTAFC